MRVLFILSLLVVGALADVPLMDEDLMNQVNNGDLLKQAKRAGSLLETGTDAVIRSGARLTDVGDEDPDTTQIVPVTPVGKDVPNACAECNAIDENPEDNPATQAMQLEISEIDKRIMEVQAQIEETQTCADELEERRRKVEELTSRWSMLSEAEKKEILRNKLIIEESSISHVHQMTEILQRKVTELTEAKASIDDKAALTQTAIDEIGKMKGGSGLIVANATEEVVQTKLGSELQALHDAMKKSLEQSNNHITNLTSKIDGLHEIGFWTNVTGAGGSASADLLKAINSPERLEKFKKFVNEQKARADKNAEIDKDIEYRKANNISMDGREEGVVGVSKTLIELKNEKKKLEAQEKELKLKDTIRKLKDKLKKKKKRRVDEDY